MFTPWGFAGFILFMIAATAESNRSPFDLPEGESEIIAGYYIEYSGFKFALFFLGEYLGMFAISGLAITLFLGGWQRAVCRFWTWIPSYVWFFAKLLVLIVAVHLGARHAAAAAHGSTDELRLEIHAADGADQYRRRRRLAFHAAGLPRWLVCSLMVVGPYVLLGRGLMAGRIEKRTYRYAD